jgi:RHS repeat-associated protein
VIGPRNPQRPLGKRRGYACGRGGSFCHRWYEPQTGRYTRADPIGLPDPIDFDDSYNNLYLYAAANPILLSDPLGLFTLPFDDIPNRCRRRWEKKILPRLKAPTQKCRDFFCEVLNTDFDQLIRGAVPIILLTRGHGGRYLCPSVAPEANPDIIRIGRSSFCGSTREALGVLIHELGHYADCKNNSDRFRDEEDGCGAEVACLGFSVSPETCGRRGYPVRRP